VQGLRVEHVDRWIGQPPRRPTPRVLLWAEVDLAGGNLMVSEQTMQVGYRTETGPPKSDSSRPLAPR
jgi:hypothetical protein